MGCSVRFAGDPGCTKECVARDKSQRKTRRVEAEGEGKMIDDKKSTDPGLSAAERKTLRSREAREAIADHEEAQRVLHGNLERLREERLAREAAAGPMPYPAPELPDDTPIENVRLRERSEVLPGFVPPACNQRR